MKRNALFRIILWSIIVAFLTSLMVGGMIFNSYFNRRASRVEQILIAEATEAPVPYRNNDVNAIVTADAVNIRQSPHSDSSVMGMVEKGDQLTVTRTETVDGSQWSYITNPVSGWVRTEYLEMQPGRDLPPQETMVSSSTNGYGCPAENVRELDIEWFSGEIKIYPGNTDRITVEEDGDISDKYAMVTRLDGDSLEIRFFQEERNVIGLHSIPDKDLTITVPVDWYCESLEIETASASVEVCDLEIGEVEFSGASGSCEFDNCNVDVLDIGTASGDVRFTGSLNILDCDAASANLFAVLSNVPSRMDLDTMSGDLEVTLPKDAGFTLSMDALSENFNTDFEITHKDGKLVSGDGSCRIRISALSGDVTIHKGE